LSVLSLLQSHYFIYMLFTCAGLTERYVACYPILQKQSVLALTNHSIKPFHRVPSDQTTEPLDWNNNKATYYVLHYFNNTCKRK
jgi:hypothetical protein